MPLYLMPNGEYVDAESPEAARRAQLPSPKVNPPAELELALAAKKAFPQGDVTDIVEPGGGTKFLEGLMTDTPDEVEKFYRNKGLDTRQVEVRGKPYVVMMDPDTYQVSAANLPGLDKGDFYSGLGAALPAAALTGGIAATGGGVLPLMAGGAAAELGREGAQGLAGTQAEPWKDFGSRALVSGAMEAPVAIASGLGTMAANSLTGRGLGSKAVNQTIQDMRRGEQAGLPPVDWRWFQFSQDPVVRRMANQTRQLSPEMQDYSANQMGQVADLAQAAVPRTPGGADNVAAMQARQVYERETGVVPSPNATAGGQQIQSTVNRALDRGASQVNRAYKLRDEAAAAEQPVFDLSPLIALATPRQVEMVTAKGGLANVAAKPSGPLAGLIDTIQTLNPTQASYTGVQELRTRLGKMLDLDPVKLAESGLELGQIKQMYGATTKILMNPVNPAPTYRQAAQEASALYAEHQATKRVAQVERVLRSKDNRQINGLFNELAGTPEGLEPAFLSVIDQAGPQRAASYRNMLMSRIVNEKDPLAALDVLKRDAGVGYAWLVKDPAIQESLGVVARYKKAMESSAFRKAYELADQRAGFAKGLLQQEAVDGPSSRRLVQTMGGQGSPGHQALQTAAFETALDGAFEFNKKAGREALNPDVLQRNIAKMKETRQWSEVLTPENRDKLAGLLGYARTSWVSGDSGGELVNAGLVRKLISMQGHEALGEIAGSRWMARMMMTPWLSRDALEKAATKASRASAKPAFSGRWPRALGTVLDDLIAEMPKQEISPGAPPANPPPAGTQ